MTKDEQITCACATIIEVGADIEDKKELYQAEVRKQSGAVELVATINKALNKIIDDNDTDVAKLVTELRKYLALNEDAVKRNYYVAQGKLVMLEETVKYLKLRQDSLLTPKPKPQDREQTTAKPTRTKQKKVK